MEILVRAALGKYITSKQLTDTSDSVKTFIEEDILKKIANDNIKNPNEFRKHKLYCSEMEDQIKLNYDLLLSIFKLYKAKDKTKYFWIEHWIAFLESVNLIGPHTGKN